MWPSNNPLYYSTIDLIACDVTYRAILHFEWLERKMVKSCCAIGCFNKYNKGSGLSFYRFPADKERCDEWITAVKWKNWQPNEHTWLCSAHFVSGKKKVMIPSLPTIYPAFLALLVVLRNAKVIEN